MKTVILVLMAMVAGTSYAKKAQDLRKEGDDMTALSVQNQLLTPEILWSMKRISVAQMSSDGKTIVYQVGQYNIEENNGQQLLYAIKSDGTGRIRLTNSKDSETDPSWIAGTGRIAFLSNGELWDMDQSGEDRHQLTHSNGKIEGYLFSHDAKHVILIKSIPYNDIIKATPDDLPKASGRLITDLMYRHWDHYVESIPHPFLAEVCENGIGEGKDLLANEPYECPTEPFGGVEQLSWSPENRFIAYSCKKKTGLQYAISTDADIYIYDTETGETYNICKSNDYQEPPIDPTHTMQDQVVNNIENLKNNPGYDTNPEFSPNGKYIAWLSMARNGYESDRNRLCVYDLSTKEKFYVTENLDTNVDAFCWNNDSKSLAFTAVWHGKTNIYTTNLNGEIEQITFDKADYVAVSCANNGKNLLALRQSYTEPTDIFMVSSKEHSSKTSIKQITFENKDILDNLAKCTSQEHWIASSDGTQMLCWIILPPNFDPNKKYPAILFCEGGPQSPVSQFWSYRWNFSIMAANGYVIIAPNRHGLPGFGTQWNEQVSGDWTGLCIKDYLMATDYAADSLPYVDRDRIGAVGASFGGYSVYFLAGIHQGRFKCFIAHDGAFNLESMYTDTEEVWFSNWEYEDAFWNENASNSARKTYENSPHKYVDKWDTPILCIHGEKDYRINYNQGMGAFNAACLKGIPAELLLFPDENHWVLKPQNGILWQRTFFEWLDRWLKAN